MCQISPLKVAHCCCLWLTNWFSIWIIGLCTVDCGTRYALIVVRSIDKSIQMSIVFIPIFGWSRGKGQPVRWPTTEENKYNFHYCESVLSIEANAVSVLADKVHWLIFHFVLKITFSLVGAFKWLMCQPSTKPKETNRLDKCCSVWCKRVPQQTIVCASVSVCLCALVSVWVRRWLSVCANHQAFAY